MKYDFAKEKMSQGIPMARTSWENKCRIVRAAIESDYEYLNYPTTGEFVDDCSARECDCKIVLFRPSLDDIAADDWQEMKAVAA